jgi:hypothetical protein
MNGSPIGVPSSEQRLEYERRKRFDYAQLCTQIVNVFASAKKDGVEFRVRDECVAQASANILDWLNRSAEES